MNLRIKIYKKPMILNVSKEALCRDIIASFAKSNLYNHFSVLLCNFNYIIYIYLHYTHKLRPLLTTDLCSGQHFHQAQTCESPANSCMSSQSPQLKRWAEGQTRQMGHLLMMEKQLAHLVLLEILLGLHSPEA